MFSSEEEHCKKQSREQSYESNDNENGENDDSTYKKFNVKRMYLHNTSMIDMIGQPLRLIS